MNHHLFCVIFWLNSYTVRVRTHRHVYHYAGCSWNDIWMLGIGISTADTVLHWSMTCQTYLQIKMGKETHLWGASRRGGKQRGDSRSKRITNKLANDVTIRLILGCGEVGKKKINPKRTEDVATKSLNNWLWRWRSNSNDAATSIDDGISKPTGGCRKVPCVIWYYTIKHKCDVSEEGIQRH
jgi:hypothetical protein